MGVIEVGETAKRSQRGKIQLSSVVAWIGAASIGRAVTGRVRSQRKRMGRSAAPWRRLSADYAFG
jgi:hypothetical protein